MFIVNNNSKLKVKESNSTKKDSIAINKGPSLSHTYKQTRLKRNCLVKCRCRNEIIKYLTRLKFEW